MPLGVMANKGVGMAKIDGCICANDARPPEPGGPDGGNGYAPVSRRWCPGCAPVGAGARNIVLFSDGTGNSSGKLFKTNVWRMYEAVDLGPISTSDREQIAFYDDGVGTSGLKPIALLGGIFGQGLKRNVLDIYKFACRSYKPSEGQEPNVDREDKGDLIYSFGFSRGAFTIRLVIALIADQGLVPYENEHQLDQQARAAYRKFRRNVKLRYPYSPMTLVRWMAGGIGLLWRAMWRTPPYEQEKNWRPVIRFIGVWDTVSAYGGPIMEVTRAIDNWIHPLSMPNYTLNERVQRARHALALDDERDSFHPLLWDEVAEQTIIEQRKNDSKMPAWLDDRRLEQVWFAGMHADVGGGYPDESLSFVSLLWMVEEAQKAGLRTVNIVIDRYRALASSLGPIHDSRSGIGAYYRYQPRRIESWLDTDATSYAQLPEGSQLAGDVASRTASLRDPAMIDDQGRQRGLLNDVKVHESVIARIAKRKDYAPFVLPPAFRTVPPGREGEAKLQATSGTDGGGTSGDPSPATTMGECAAHTAGTPSPISVIPPEVRKALDREAIAMLGRSLEPVWNRVWQRRATYFATLAVTLALLLMPFWIGYTRQAPFLTDGRNWLSGLIQLLATFFPRFLLPLIDTYSNNSFWFLLCVTAIFGLRWVGGRLELSLRTSTRRAWDDAIDPPPDPKWRSSGLLDRVRNSALYQRAIQVGRWHVLPFFVAMVILMLLGWAALAVVTQLSLPIYERSSRLCPGTAPRAPDLSIVSANFDPRHTCNRLDVTVREAETYLISFRVDYPWYDSGRLASPEGLKATELGFLGLIAAPLRRVVQAGYLQPVLMIRPRAEGTLSKNVFIYPLTLHQDEKDAKVFSGKFTAKRTGQAYLFANDAVIPFTGKIFGEYNLLWFYEYGGFGKRSGNHGTACVTVEHVASRNGKGGATSSPTCISVAPSANAVQQKRAGTSSISNPKPLLD